MTSNQQESFMTQVLSQPGKHSPGQIIAAVAMGRWLNVSEIETLLNHEHNVLAVSTAPPTTPPPSGSLLLFNRSITRNYKDDGHEWIRKRNSNKVREDHVKLRVGGKFRVSGCYVHSSKSMTFHRRAYHLLNPDSGTALYPVTNASKAGKNNTPPSLILVHYLDTKIATANCNKLVERGIDINPALYPSSMHSQNAMLAARLEHGSFNRPQDGFHPRSSEMNPSSGEYDYPDFMNSFSSGFDGSTDLEGKAIDFLWDVVVEEGNDDIRMNGSNLSELLTPELIEKMFDSETVGNLFENGELFGMTHSEMDVDQQSENSDGRGNKSMEAIQEEPDVETPSSSRDAKPTALILGPEAFIPEIVDITPESIAVDKDPVKMVISCNHSSPGTFKRDDDCFVWKQFACFFENWILQGQRVKLVKCTEAKLLNPYTYQCSIPDCFLKTGSYQIMVIAVKVEASVQYSRTMIAHDLSRLIDNVFQSNSYQTNLPTRYHSVKFEEMEVKLLTQLSKSSFSYTNAHNVCDYSSESGSGSAISSSLIRSDLPAPPPAMALVATMLSDFPNPPPGAVLPPETTISRLDSKSRNEKITFEEAKETSTTDANKMFSSAMEATVSGSKKRSNSHVEIPRRTTLDNSLPVCEAPTAADLWASQTSNSHDVETNAEEVDRHCKIRFVERLTSVISEAGGDVFVKEAFPGNVTRTDVDGGYSLTIDPNEMRALDDDELDNILDSLLVKIVESLVEMSASECDIQEELNAPDRSGFTLLHYAALYNLQSLIPVLLSRGANPDIKSLRGDVTPLHLACGSGNTAIVQLLLRHGCSLEVADCFGSYPADHAMRNGFHALAAMLQHKALEEKGMKATVEREVHQSRPNDEQRKNKMKELEKLRLQEAFANLSLKDKLALNMLFKQRILNRTSKKRVANIREFDTCTKQENELDTDLGGVDDVSSGLNVEKAVDLTEMEMQKDDKSECNSDELSSVISESDKESLDIAMKLMNAKELEDLEKTTDVHKDLKDWMLRRNYESLKETSETLQKTLQEHKKEKVSRSSSSTPDSSPSVDEASTKYAKSAAIRSLKNMQSQAIASLVLRKNLKETMKTKGN
eukprot:CAMPEP_0176477488 /NCGR_PEP_ID=MMETSP0200_2-20121128/649_1 /TAXON_ID=947934 /ORGANISM="Chaetoceros sp., Strain GSL56" /LENGTH=1094 /DNA_ID=CAMNT_0017873301 /DNA_START=171 /DNA_END=3455 /DNA_ORIENTATION=-